MSDSLLGTFSGNNATLVINQDDPWTGNASGTFTYQDGSQSVEMNITVHYHHTNGHSAEPTFMRIWGSKDDPNYFMGAAGVAGGGDFSSIRICGGWADDPQNVSQIDATLNRTA